RPDVLRRGLEEALRVGLIERVDVSYRFIHDRVHEAILSRLEVAKARDINQAVAEALERMGDQSGPTLHALARHYARGHAEKHQDRIYETSLRAGVNALEAFSNTEAVDLLGRAYRAGEIIGISAESKAMVSELLGVACTRTGKVDAATNHFRAALAQAKTPKDRARLHFLVGNAFASKGAMVDAKRELEIACRMEGAPVSKSKPALVFNLLRVLISTVIRSKTGWGYGSAKGEERQRRVAVSNIQNALRFLGLLLNDPLLLILMSFREIHNGHFLGTSRENARAHGFHALTLAVLQAKGPVKHHRNVGLAMARQLGDPEALAYTAQCSSLGLEIIGEIKAGQRAQDEVLPDVIRYGTSFDTVSLLAHHSLALTGQGRSRDSVDYILNNLEVANRSGHEGMQAALYGSLYSQLTLLGRIPDALKARDQCKRLASSSVFAKMHNAYSHVWALHEQADYGPEIDHAIEEFFKLNIDEYQNRQGYVAAAYARLEQLQRAQGHQAQKKAKAQLMMALKELKSGPPAVKAMVYWVHTVVIEAAIARIDKRYRKARAMLDRASQMERDRQHLGQV